MKNYQEEEEEEINLNNLETEEWFEYQIKEKNQIDDNKKEEISETQMVDLEETQDENGGKNSMYENFQLKLGNIL